MPDPRVLGLDIVFPAVMGGLAVASITGRQALVAAGSGALFGGGVALLAGTTAGVLAGGIVGPLVGMALPAGRSGPGGVPEAAFVPPADGMPG
jgi:predicted branched-subunit amino acid permease